MFTFYYLIIILQFYILTEYIFLCIYNCRISLYCLSQDTAYTCWKIVWEWIRKKFEHKLRENISIVGITYQENFLFSFFFFFQPYLQHMEVPGLGNWNCNCQPTLQPQQRRIQATSATFAAACDKARSLAHWAIPGIELASSDTMLGSYPAEPQKKLSITFP